MDRRKADVCHFVYPLELFHHVVSNGGATYFLFICTPFFLELGEQLIYLLLADRALGTRKPDATFEFRPTIGLTGAVTFNDNERRKLLAFEGGKPVVALCAFPASTYSSAVFRHTRIDYSRIVTFAAGTVHGGNVECRMENVKW